MFQDTGKVVLVDLYIDIRLQVYAIGQTVSLRTCLENQPHFSGSGILSYHWFLRYVENAITVAFLEGSLHFSFLRLIICTPASYLSSGLFLEVISLF